MIKASLQCHRKGIRLSLTFDKELYESGLYQLEKEVTDPGRRGVRKYSIAKYSDLNSILGDKWFIRGINPSGDFCYVVLETVRFYLTKKPALPDYNPDTGTVNHYFRGYNLIFSFVRGDGVAQDFQKIFCLP